MKLKILILSLLLSFNGLAQQAPSFKVVDIFGNFYNSNDIIENGKSIFIDFFSNNCSSCQMQIPFVDTVFKYYGCNTDSIVFLAMNINSYSSNKSVFDFCQQFGVSFPAFSGDGGSSQVADNFNVPYTPYYILIDTNNNVVYNDFFWIDSSSELVDTINSYINFTPCSCKGNDFEYFRIISLNDTVLGEIDKIHRTVKFDVPMDFDLTKSVAFFISSANSRVYLDGILQNSDSSVIDLTDTLYYQIFSEIDTISSVWRVFAEKNTAVEKNELESNQLFFVDNQANVLYLKNCREIKNYKIYNLKGQLLFKINPTQEEQNLSHLQAGIYIIALQTKDGKLVFGKFFVK